MKRYALSTLTGVGTIEDPVRPVLSDLDVMGVVVTIAPPAQRMNKNWVLCVVAGTEAQLNAASTNANVNVLPLGPEDLDTSWLDMGGNNLRNQFANAIRNRTGVAVEREDPRTLREIITAIGTELDPNFNPDNMDINDDPTPLFASI